MKGVQNINIVNQSHHPKQVKNQIKYLKQIKPKDSIERESDIKPFNRISEITLDIAEIQKSVK